MSDRIDVRISEIQSAADRVKAQADQIEEATRIAEQSITPLRSMTSNRIFKILEAWDMLTRSIDENIAQLRTTADEQVRTAKAFHEADQ